MLIWRCHQQATKETLNCSPNPPEDSLFHLDLQKTSSSQTADWSYHICVCIFTLLVFGVGTEADFCFSASWTAHQAERFPYLLFDIINQSQELDYTEIPTPAVPPLAHLTFYACPSRQEIFAKQTWKLHGHHKHCHRMCVDQIHNGISKFTKFKAVIGFWEVCQKLLVYVWIKSFWVAKKFEKIESC